MKTQKNKSSNTLSDNSHFILYNISNYKTSIDNSITDILTKITTLIIEYMRFISEKILMKNKAYYLFVFERGIDTLIHVFSVMFYYTKNLELSFYHTQKAYYFYIEFIEQISDDNINFLQLSSRDAILFVYKKTIFDINNEYKKTINEPTADEKIILSTVDEYTHIYKKIVLFMINHISFKYDNKTNYINKCCDSFELISEIINKNKIKPNYIQYIYIFSTALDDKNIDIFDYFKLLEEFIKKLIYKKKINDKNIKNNINSEETNNFIINNNLNDVIEYIFID